MSKASIVVRDFRALRRNTLVEFCSIRIAELRLRVFPPFTVEEQVP